MADKIFPWTEIVPDIPEDDYIWDCVDTEITEAPDIISLCETGLFRSLARIHFGGVGGLDLLSHLRVQFHSRPIITFATRSLIPTVRDFVSVSGIVFDVVSDGPNIQKLFSASAHIQFVTAGKIHQIYHAETDIVTSITSDGNAERELASTASITFKTVSHAPDARYFESTASITFDASSDAKTERELASQADIVSDILSDINGGGDDVFVPSGTPLAHFSADTIEGLNDGDPVVTWEDQANNNDFTQVDSGLRGLYKTDIQNGLPGVHLTVNDQLYNSTISLTQPDTIFMVFNLTDVSGSGALWDASGSRQLFYDWGTNWQIYAGAFLDSGVEATTGIHIVTVGYNGASSFIRLDGVEIAAGQGGLANMGNMTLGRGGTSSGLGYYHEVIVYDNAEDYEENEAGLMAKWGISVGGGIDSFTVLMLHLDGDQSDSQHTVTHNGNPQYNSVIKKF